MQGPAGAARHPRATGSRCMGLTWSPWACLPMVMGLVQPGTRRGIFLQMMGSRNTVPPRMFRMVPLGLFHIFFSLNSGVCRGKAPEGPPH